MIADTANTGINILLYKKFLFTGTIKAVMEKHQLYNKILTDEDLSLAENLHDVLEFFQTTTTILSGSQFPTVHLSLLFQSELRER